MTYAAHQRITASGTIAAGGGVGEEIFTFSLASLGGLSDSALATAVAPVMTTWFHGTDTTNGCRSNTSYHLTEVRVESISTAGRVLSSYAVPVDSLGGSDPASGAAPGLCCWAITLETETDNGHGRNVRGRFYPPNVAWYVTGSAPLSAGTGFGDNIARSGSRLVTDLNAAGAEIVVASQTAGGQNAPVTSCSADNLVDTQRRRKNHATSSRGSHSVPF